METLQSADVPAKIKMRKKVIETFISIILCALVFTALTAILPYPPYILSEVSDLKPISFGFPICYVDQMPDSESIAVLEKKNINNSFILPRYDKYKTDFHVDNAFACLGINILIFATIYIIFKYSKKLILCLILGSAVTVASAILPVTPGTFTAEELNPMKFGFVIKFIEQTSNVNLTWEDLDTYLEQTYIAPKYNEYITHINVGNGIACLLLNTLIIAVGVFIIKIIISLIRYGVAETKRIYIEPIRILQRQISKKTKRNLTKAIDKQKK